MVTTFFFMNIFVCCFWDSTRLWFVRWSKFLPFFWFLIFQHPLMTYWHWIGFKRIRQTFPFFVPPLCDVFGVSAGSFCNSQFHHVNDVQTYPVLWNCHLNDLFWIDLEHFVICFKLFCCSHYFLNLHPTDDSLKQTQHQHYNIDSNQNFNPFTITSI